MSVRGDVIIVDEDKRVVHALWGFLVTLTLVGLWALNAFVEMTKENRIAGNVTGGLMAAAFVTAWVYGARHPAHLEISHDAIVQKRRGRKGSLTIRRTTGDLAFEVRSAALGGRGTVYPVLTVPGDGDDGSEIGISSYDRNRIKQACEALGWRFAPPKG